MNWYQELRKAYQQGKSLKVSEIANLIFADEARDSKSILKKEYFENENILQIECTYIPNTGASEEMVIYRLDLNQDFSKKVIYIKKFIKEEIHEFNP